MIASLSGRLLLAVTLLLLVFFGATIFVLDLSFRGAAERAMRDRLDVQIVVLLAAAEVSASGALEMPDELAEASFDTPGSGLFGEIITPEGERLWRSASLVGDGLPGTPLAPGQKRFERTRTRDDEPVFQFALGVDFQGSGGGSRRLTFIAAQDLEPYRAEVGRFRRQLFGWFALLTVALIAAQAAIMRILLRPLRRVAREIAEVEAGERAALGGGYPAELRGVTENLNALIAGERARLEGYRRTLGNLAHSLKTPLAVIASALARPGDPSVIAAQVERMRDIVGYQLQRAATWGGSTLGSAPIDVARVVEQVVGALAKVYAEKAPQFDRDLSPEARFYGEEGDLMEIAGNLLDNACKWCRQRVRIQAAPLRDGEQRRAGLRLVVEDDGPGIAEQDRARVLERGVRADERTPGYGIGLAVVRDIARLHGGELTIASSPLGGARVEIALPGR